MYNNLQSNRDYISQDKINLLFAINKNSFQQTKISRIYYIQSALDNIKSTYILPMCSKDNLSEMHCAFFDN